MKKILAYFLVAGLLFPYSAWAVCPVVETVAISHDASATESTKTHDLPTGIVSGDMLVLFFSEMDGRTATVTGWTPLFELAADANSFAGFYRRADGTEGATVAVNLSGSTSQGTAHIYRISGHHATTDPEAGTIATATSTNPDPPTLSPSYGAEDTLWLAVAAHRNTSNFTGFPTNYTNGQTDTTHRPEMGSARRCLNAASEDPGTFTVTSNLWKSNTVAIRPAAAAVSKKRQVIIVQ